MSSKPKLFVSIKYQPGFEIEYAMLNGKSILNKNRRFIVDLDSLPASVRAFIYEQVDAYYLQNAERQMEDYLANGLIPQVFAEMELDAGCVLIGKNNLVSVLRKTMRQSMQYRYVDVTVQRVRISVYDATPANYTDNTSQDIDYFRIVE